MLARSKYSFKKFDLSDKKNKFTVYVFMTYFYAKGIKLL